MPRDRQPAGACPQCDQTTLQCNYNLFDNGTLRIDSWEHKCPNCGHRETRAFRSDDEDQPDDPTRCPYCARSGAPA